MLLIFLLCWFKERGAYKAADHLFWGFFPSMFKGRCQMQLHSDILQFPFYSRLQKYSLEMRCPRRPAWIFNCFLKFCMNNSGEGGRLIIQVISKCIHLFGIIDVTISCISWFKSKIVFFNWYGELKLKFVWFPSTFLLVTFVSSLTHSFHFSSWSCFCHLGFFDTFLFYLTKNTFGDVSPLVHRVCMLKLF